MHHVYIIRIEYNSTFFHCVYTRSLWETRTVLSNPRLSSQMYFGCGIETKEKRHGEITHLEKSI
jgi:hypothetical protein